MLTSHCLPDENGTSPKSTVNEIENSMKNHQIKPKRRHSWPSEKIANKNISDGNMNGSLSFIEETRKDFVLNSLLHELRFSRQLNRHLCLQLNKAKAELQLFQQTNEKPGSIAILVRRLYDMHQIRSDVLSNWNSKTEDLYGRSSHSSYKSESDDTDNLLLRERETLVHKLQSTERKIHQLRQVSACFY